VSVAVSPRLVLAAASGYLVGTLPSADIAAGVAGGGTVDLRSHGSRNPGAMNVRRLLGRRVGIVVAAADIGKGAAACAAGRRLACGAGAHVAGVGAVAGHCYPLWTAFRGGKGVATSFGQCLYTFPAYAPIDLAVATAVVRIPGLRRPALVSTAAASAAWLAAAVVWWKRGWPNLWGPEPSAALPLGATGTIIVIGSRLVASLVRGEQDELEPR
jgi:glycerol-3-phosphate acyltransferase PlsY